MVTAMALLRAGWQRTQSSHSSPQGAPKNCSSGAGLCNGQQGEEGTVPGNQERKRRSGPEKANAEENQGLELLKKLANQQTDMSK